MIAIWYIARYAENSSKTRRMQLVENRGRKTGRKLTVSVKNAT